MSDILKPIRSNPAPLPPAAGQFGYRSHGTIVDFIGFRPNGCPRMDQFEAAFLVAKQPPKAS